MKKLTKSSEKRFAGVIGGIAEYFNIDPTLARLAYAFILVFTGFIPGIVFYLIAMVIMPDKALHSEIQRNTENNTVHDVPHTENSDDKEK